MKKINEFFSTVIDGLWDWLYKNWNLNLKQNQRSNSSSITCLLKSFCVKGFCMLKWQCWQSSSILGSKYSPQFWHTGSPFTTTNTNLNRVIKTLEEYYMWITWDDKLFHMITPPRVYIPLLCLQVLCISQVQLSILDYVPHAMSIRFLHIAFFQMSESLWLLQQWIQL